MSTRTFFSYFASKEDVVFYDTTARLGLALATMESRRPDETVTAVLLRIVEESFEQAASYQDLTAEEAALRMRLILTEPQLQARALLILFDTQLQLGRALHGAFPELTPGDAAAAVGALIGAIKLSVMATLEQDQSLTDILGTARRAAELAIAGLHTLD